VRGGVKAKSKPNRVFEDVDCFVEVRCGKLGLLRAYFVNFLEIVVTGILEVCGLGDFGN
jgi:hypothetical protein